MRIPIVAGNWKMNTNLAEAIELVSQMRDRLDAIDGVIKIICPPFISIASIEGITSDTSIKVGAQNVFPENKGAFTGEISPTMLTWLCHYVIIGHSERRQHFDETGGFINKKLKAIARIGLNPILCIGETASEREEGKTEAVLSSQINEALAGIHNKSSIIIAYEPVWAIGTGLAASGKQAQDTISFIRHEIARWSNEGTSQAIPILYGGSVSSANVAEFVTEPDIDGVLVGSASLKPDEFIQITKITAEIKAGV
jgi:triosephosphate isomerase